MRNKLILSLMLGFTSLFLFAQNHPNEQENDRRNNAKLASLIEFTIDEIASHKHQRPVVLYANKRFQGKSFALRYDWTTDYFWNDWNDAIGSIEVPRGMEIWLYEHSNFQGRVLVIEEDWSVHDNPWWEDRISSIRIFDSHHRTPPPKTRRNRPYGNRHRHGCAQGHRHGKYRKSGVTVYEDRHFSGKSVIIKRDWSIGDSDDFWNDRISSIDVPSGYTAILYKHARFEGRSLKLRGPCSIKLERDEWNDEVSSIKIRKR